jgi:ABC-type transport system involved in cytochrome c biogenesis ATPase subunit
MAAVCALETAIATVGLQGFENRTIGTLSGGQMQRALFARLLLQDAPLILLDEPFASVDSQTVRDLLAIVRRWHAEKRHVIRAARPRHGARSFRALCSPASRWPEARPPRCLSAEESAARAPHVTEP